MKGYRDPATGQYTYDGKWDRLCVCGHRLGDHVAGGFECGLFDHTKGCECARFRPTGKRGADVETKTSAS